LSLVVRFTYSGVAPYNQIAALDNKLSWSILERELVLMSDFHLFFVINCLEITAVSSSIGKLVETY